MRKLVLYAVVGLLVCAGSATAAATITGMQVQDNSLTTRDIKNKTLKKADLSGSAVRSLRGQRGAVGSAGPAGPVNVGGIVRVTGSAVIAPGAVGHATATCPPGFGLISGGNTYISADGEIFYEDDLSSHNSWSFGGRQRRGRPDRDRVLRPVREGRGRLSRQGAGAAAGQLARRAPAGNILRPARAVARTAPSRS